MQIAFITPGQLPVATALGGSVETYVDEVSQLLGQHKITIFGCSATGDSAHEVIKGVTHRRLPAPTWQEYLKLVTKELTKQTYDIIQIENRPGFVPDIKAVAPQSKIILNLHSLTFVKAQKFSSTQPIVGLQQADLILVNSNFVADEINNMFPQLSTPITVIHLAANPHTFPAKWSRKGKIIRQRKRRALGVTGKKVILFAGRLVSSKGVHVLLEAMRLLGKYQRQCTLLIAGGTWYGSNRKNAYVRKLYGLAKNKKFQTIFLKFIPHSRMRDYYLSSDLLVCPSLGPEAFGLVNVEAMAAGLPVIASNQGGIPEVVKHRETGYLIPTNSPKAMASVLRHIFKNQNLQQRLGLKGRQQVELYFNWERVAKQLDAIYSPRQKGVGESDNYF